ncbi:MAG: hypothetical protein ACRECP_11420 [Methylocella sp.]
MFERDKAIIRYLKSRQGIIGISLGLTIAGIVFIIFTGRYELGWWVAFAQLPWIEHWLRRNKQ